MKLMLVEVFLEIAYQGNKRSGSSQLSSSIPEALSYHRGPPTSRARFRNVSAYLFIAQHFDWLVSLSRLGIKGR